MPVNTLRPKKNDKPRSTELGLPAPSPAKLENATRQFGVHGVGENSAFALPMLKSAASMVPSVPVSIALSSVVEAGHRKPLLGLGQLGIEVGKKFALEPLSM